MRGRGSSPIPERLTHYDQFVLYREVERDGRMTKMPCQPDGSPASTTDPNTWVSYKRALEALREGSFDGLGFVFTEDDPFVGIDCDDCMVDGTLTDQARRHVDEFDSYAEVSPSGTGIHIICRGDFPESGRRTPDVEGMKEIEVYREGRFFTITGDRLEGTPATIERRSDKLQQLHERLFEAESGPEKPTGTPSKPTNLSDREVVERAKESNEKFPPLWEGDINPYPSQSEADLAFVSLLAFWTGGDRQQIDRIFRQSGLYREKWEREDYRKRTIDKALEGKTDFYTPTGGQREGKSNSPSTPKSPGEQSSQTTSFWYVGSDGSVKLDRRRFLKFLRDHGIGKFYGESQNRSELVRVEDKVVRRISSEELKDFVLRHVRSLDAESIKEDCTPEEIEEMLLRGANVYFSDALLEGLRPLDLEFVEDTAEEAFFFFQNGYVQVTAEGYDLNAYSTLDGVIWESQVIERDFIDLQGEDGFDTWDWHQHLYYVSGQDRKRHNALCTGLGYLLHGYKDPSETKAIILMDEEPADFEEGRSGKSLTARALQEVVPTVRIDGRNFCFQSRFAFQRVEEDTQIVDFNDVRPTFPFEKLFSVITDEMPVERKGKTEFTIPFEQSPKFLLSTNYVIKGGGASFEDRTFQIEFAPYYSPDWTPVDEFGHRFFEDWDEEQWARFDNVMLACVRQYLRDGLVDYDHVNLRKRKLRQETHPNFAEWIRDFITLGEEYDKKAIWRTFTEAYEPDHDDLASYTTTQWVKTFAEIYDLEVDERKSGRNRYITLHKN